MVWAMLLLALGVFLWLGRLRPVRGPDAIRKVPETADEIAGYLQARETSVPGVRAGAEMRALWAGAPGEVTEVVVVYVHGFSATSVEIAPVPEQVAAAYGANLFYARLTGHGIDGAAMARATGEDWLGDIEETLALARLMGRKVLVIATSTGGTLAAWAATEPRMAEALAGIAFVSPNFGMRHRAFQVLKLPWAGVWAPWIAGRHRDMPAKNAAHAAGWTLAYPSRAVMPVMRLVAGTLRRDLSKAHVPAMAFLSEEDEVVDPAATRKAATRWGGSFEIALRETAEGDDPHHHVIAGDIISPAGTTPAVEAILSWSAGFLPRA